VLVDPAVGGAATLVHDRLTLPLAGAHDGGYVAVLRR
jgi:hypothetical protein